MTTRFFAVAVAILLASCSGSDSCGPGTTIGSSVVATDGAVTFEYGSFVASPNMDCPNPGSPTPITVQGTQDGLGRPFVLCISQPEVIEDGVTFSLQPTGVVRLIDLQAKDGDCNITAHDTGGEVAFSGFCADGTSAEGFALTVSGSVPATKSCVGLADEEVELELSGAASVAAESALSLRATALR